MVAAAGQTDAVESAETIAAPADLAAVAKAIGHPARVEIIRLVHAQPLCAGVELSEAIGLAPSTVSEHLRILRAAGVITATPDRPRTIYSLNPAAFELLRAFLGLVSLPVRN